MFILGVVEDLEKIKQLKDAGAITETEFEIEKQKLLNNDLQRETTTDKKETKAIVGFILGLVGIIAWFLPIIGVPVTILGIIFSALGMNTKNKNKAIAGLILSIVFLIVTLINSFLGVLMTSTLYYY